MNVCITVINLVQVDRIELKEEVGFLKPLGKQRDDAMMPSMGDERTCDAGDSMKTA